jgi:predicted dehydrogenase
MKKRLAIVGYGGQGAWHAEHAMRSDVVELAGIRDIAEKRINAAREKGIRVYESLEEILADDSVDIVLCATPNDVHKDIVVQSLLAGKNVICEKPVALSVGDFDEMLAAAEKSGAHFSVHQNRRWDVDYLAMKSLVDSGEIGDVINIESRIHGSRGIPSDWRCHKPYGGGMILDWGVHFLDLILYILGGAKLKTVTCDAYSEMAKDMKSYKYTGMWAEDTSDIENGTNDVDDFITGHVRTDKASISFNGAWAQNIDANDMFIDFLGDKGGARLTYGGKFVFWSADTLEKNSPRI